MISLCFWFVKERLYLKGTSHPEHPVICFFGWQPLECKQYSLGLFWYQVIGSGRESVCVSLLARHIRFALLQPQLPVTCRPRVPLREGSHHTPQPWPLCDEIRDLWLRHTAPESLDCCLPVQIKPLKVVVAMLKQMNEECSPKMRLATSDGADRPVTPVCSELSTISSPHI